MSAVNPSPALAPGRRSEDTRDHRPLGVRVRWNALELDASLASGSDPASSEELALRAAQLAEPATCANVCLTKAPTLRADWPSSACSSRTPEVRWQRFECSVPLSGLQLWPNIDVSAFDSEGKHVMSPRAVLQETRSTPARRVLLLTSEDLADANEVPEPIRPLIAEAEDIYVLAPALTTWLQWVATDVDRARVAADERLHRVFDHMHADGLAPRGAVADENQLVAIADALLDFDADLIVLRLHDPDGEHPNWQEHRVAERVRSHFDVPTIAFYFDKEGQVVGREEA